MAHGPYGHSNNIRLLDHCALSRISTKIKKKIRPWSYWHDFTVLSSDSDRVHKELSKYYIKLLILTIKNVFKRF